MTDLVLLASSPVIGLLAKISVVLACGLLLASMRRIGPALRHSILLASVCGALALPLLSVAAPRWNAAILPSTLHGAPSAGGKRTAWMTARVSAPDMSQTNVSDRSVSVGQDIVSAAATSSHSSPSSAAREGTDRNPSIVTVLLIALWLLGALTFLARLLVGRVKVRAIAARAWSPDDAEWTRLLEEEKRLAGVSSLVRLLVSPAASTPMTWGTRIPIVLLPEDALQWAGDRRRIVLRHELAHIARRDSLAQSISAIACAFYWFHPLALIATKRMRTECERACDDRVLALGTGPDEYASHLLDVARSAREMGSPGLLSLALARPSQLEGRLLAVLDGSLPRATPTRRAQVSAVVLPLALAVVGSAFHPVPRVATVAPIVLPTTPPPRPAGRGVLPTTAGRSTLAPTVVGPVATPIVEPVGAPVASRRDVDANDFLRNNVEILLRADPTLPDNASVQVVITKDENLVLVNDDVAHPLDLRAAIELVKQIRANYGRDIPGDAVQIPVSYRAPSTRRSDAEPYEQLLQRLQDAPTEEINRRPAARHFLFYENADVELAVSDSTLAKLIKTNTRAGR